jgi:hypothetical protein
VDVIPEKALKLLPEVSVRHDMGNTEMPTELADRLRRLVVESSVLVLCSKWCIASTLCCPDLKTLACFEERESQLQSLLG